MFSHRLLSRLRDAQTVVAFTGAGISAESGVPTFRGENGIWKKFKPQELATVEAFMRNPDLVWEWYNHRRDVIASVKPNAGHFALAAMESHHHVVTVATQNIDNLHRRAGSSRVFELHGSIERSYCNECGRRYSAAEDLTVVDRIPHCTDCNGIIRPDVVWFGEDLPIEVWNASVAVAERADVFFAIGTSAVVYPAASLPMIARRAGAYVVEINIEPTEISHSVDETILGKAGDILPMLLKYCYSPVYM